MRKDFYLGSNHLPISVFSFVPPLSIFEPRLLWRKTDEEVVKERAKEICTFPRNSSIVSDIDFSVNIFDFMDERGN